MDEHWKDIPDYEGLYQVSDQGNVRSLDRITIYKSKHGKTSQRMQKGRILKPSMYEYPIVMLSKQGSPSPHYVHRLVWSVFICPIPSDEEINHENGIKTDCRLSNLMCGSRSYNAKHAQRIGLKKNIGEENPNAKFSKEIIIKARALRENGCTYANIGNRLNMTEGNARFICSRKTWKSVK